MNKINEKKINIKIKCLYVWSLELYSLRSYDLNFQYEIKHDIANKELKMLIVSTSELILCIIWM